MNQNWLSFLQSQNTKLVDNNVVDFGQPDKELQAIDEGSVIAELGYLGLVEVDGDDATDFLQNQFSNDVREVSETASQLSNYCNPKGRILASFRLFFWQKRYFMRLPQDTIEATVKRLKMFVLRSKVTINDVSNEYSCIGIAGADSHDLLQQQGLPVPSPGADAAAGNQDYMVIRLAGETERYEIHGKTENIISLWTSLKDKLTPVAASAWRLYDIRSAIPEVVAATVEEFIPQMLNMQAINGVSFTKGCYPGQEIVARTQYLGKVKRHMYKGRTSQPCPAAPGDEIIADNSKEGQRNGTIVTAQNNAQGETEFLAVIPTNIAESSMLYLGSHDGPQATLEELPYSLERSK